MNIPTITLWRPWAQFVALGLKTIETRTHRRFASLEGRTIGIIAGGTFNAGDALQPTRNGQ